MKIGIIALAGHDPARMMQLLRAIEDAGHTHAMLAPEHVTLTGRSSVDALRCQNGLDELIVVDSQENTPVFQPEFQAELQCAPYTICNGTHADAQTEYLRNREHQRQLRINSIVQNPCLPARFKKGSKR